ncbi:Protein VTE6, chloroplastic, partial [Mucuna pruriens]
MKCEGTKVRTRAACFVIHQASSAGHDQKMHQLGSSLAHFSCSPVGVFLIAASRVGSHEAIICVLAAQIANVGESIIGAALQEKEGFKWLNNDAVNIINISMGSIIAVLMQQALQIWDVYTPAVRVYDAAYPDTRLQLFYRDSLILVILPSCFLVFDDPSSRSLSLFNSQDHDRLQANQPEVV